MNIRDSIKKLKESITIEEIVKVMKSLGEEGIHRSNDNEIIFRTICHNGHSHKLYLYKDSKQFHCYSNCGQLDIINIVQNALKLTTSESIKYICNILNITLDGMEIGFFDDEEYINLDMEILTRYDNYDNKEIDNNREFNKLDENILNFFYKYYHESFYNDGISFLTLNKFGIRYDILEERIIIPHRDEEGNLIAVRCRNLKEDLIELGMKYTPIVFNNKLLSAKTSTYLYGLFYNKDNIRRSKKIILLESEKAVMQLDTILGEENNIGVSLSSSSLSTIQVDLIRNYNVEEVIIGVDKEFEEYGTKQEKLYAMKVRKGIIDKLRPYFSVSVMWDKHGLLQYKDSPTDKGKEVFYKLYRDRIKI